MGAADALLVAAGVKCEAQVVRVTQRAGENRHDNRAHRLDTLGQRTGFDGTATRGLGVDDGTGLVGQRWNESQCQTHDQRDLLGVDAEPVERADQGGEGVGHGGRRGGGEEHRAQDDHQRETAGVQHGYGHALIGDAQRAQRHHRRAGAHHKQIDHAHQHQQNQNRMNGFEHP